MSCVTTPTATIFSTPEVIQTVQRTITSVTTIPVAVYTIVSSSFHCDSNVGCVSGATTFFSTDAVTSTTLVVADELITTVGDPVPIETQYGSSCIVVDTPSTPIPTPTPSSTSAFAEVTQSSSLSSLSSSRSPAPFATQESVALPHKSTNVGAIAGGAAAGVVALAVLICFFFKFSRGKRGRGETSRHHEHYEGEKPGFYPDPESGRRAEVNLSNPDDPFATPTSQQDQYNAKNRESKSAYFPTQKGAADQPAANPVATALSASGPASESKANLIATDKIPTNSTSPAMPKPHLSTPGAAVAGQPGRIAATLSASGPTSETNANLIATDKIRTNSASSAMTKPRSSTPGAAAADQPAANTVAAALSASGPTSEKADSIATDKIRTNLTSSAMTKTHSSTPGAAAADQPGTIAAALSASGPTSETMANLIATDKIRTKSTSPAMAKSAPGPGPSPSLPQTKPESSSSAPQPADPPSIPTTSADL